MRAARQSPDLACPTQAELDWFRSSGVEIMVLACPEPMRIAHGRVAHDGVFEPDPSGDRWCAFEEADVADIVFWQPRTRTLSSWIGRAFALGQSTVDRPETYSFDCNLNIFADPLDWLLAKRDGIVVLPGKWPLAYERLRDAPRIAVAESLLPLYRRHMKPRRMPELFVLPERQRRAA